MPRSFLRRFSRSRPDAPPDGTDSAEPDDRFESQFSEPSGVGARPRTRSLFSHNASSNLTGSSRGTRLTFSTGDTDLTVGSAGSSSKGRPQVLDSDSLTRSHHRFVSREQGASSIAVPLPDTPDLPTRASPVPETWEEVVELLKEMVATLRTMNSELEAASAPRIAGLIARTIQDYTRKLAACNIAAMAQELPDEIPSEIMRIILGLTDVRLVGPPYRSTRMHLLSSVEQFGKTLGLLEDPQDGLEMRTVALPRNFALGSKGRVASHENMLGLLIDQIAGGSVAISEEDGAYIAPVLRGLSTRFSVATLCFGMPTYGVEQLEALAELGSQVQMIHLYGRTDYISTAAAANGGVTAPYRVPTNPLAPPMSMSIAVADSKYISGTLGGFLYPQGDSHDGTDDSGVFAVTCGHVCLQPDDDNQAVDPETYTEPEVMVPSPVLTQLFRKALLEQRNRYSPQSSQYKAYVAALASVEKHDSRRLGEVAWGERTVVRGQMSDIAVIKCAPGIQCENWLGDDVDMSQYDPGLIMQKLKVRSIASKFRGIEVFKYGSTSKYTNGVISTARIAYWSGGSLQTSEFAVRSHTAAMFATGGDSGSWILHAKDDGLAVLGMLHSYDGEVKEFGLYTPMPLILSRLKAVTGVSWGVLGVPSHDDAVHEKGEASE